MSASAIINDGQITNLGETKEKKKGASDSVDKEQFLNLLVTQLKYQDPLQPMDNTEYVSQLATFSELEQMQNVAKSSEVSRATTMVGSLVTVEQTNEVTGATTEVTGKVDFVSVSGSNVKVSVNDVLYELDKVKQVYDNDYADASALAEEWAAAFSKLPGADNITSRNAGQFTDRVKALYNSYNSMSAYQKTFLSEDLQKGILAYVGAYRALGIDIDGTASSGSNAGNETAGNTAASEGSGTASSGNDAAGTPDSTAAAGNGAAADSAAAAGNGAAADSTAAGDAAAPAGN